MTDIQRNMALGTGITVLLVAGVYYATRGPAPAPGGQAATSTPVVGGIGATGNYTIEEIKDEGTPAPVIRPVVISADLSAEARTAITAHYAEYKKTLAKDPQDFNTWLDLAVLYKIGGDYRGAEAIWLYATKVWPTSAVPFGNLGDLYQNFLKDPAKAKLYYDQAAKLQAAQP
ncbi:tetratricopeptide repeat protein [Candidatus Kaiserbacteria bacterium]|nr:tetratricopeptide repeat protein [Candidatus Kaiserbacteria bacterium]